MLGNKKIFGLLLTTIFLSIPTYAEKLSEKAEVQGSELSKILKSSGSLVARESYELPSIATVSGNDIEAEVMVVKSLLNVSNDNIFVGLILKAKEKYSSNSANIDPDEIDGLLSSINLIETKGLSIIDNPSSKTNKSKGVSTEIHYRTKDGLIFAAFKSNEILKFGIKVSSTADWALLSKDAIATLKNNLLVAKSIAAEVK
ncbi:hypothetical protein [Neptunicella marina]|uniref:DUF4252 domain-containing protein n=1 Tax=Neptunicella marina TaxID=2125989 RepID=A0A8J6IUP4_9ALTE|nr:hypothetical protein [Neptunicella marina]MBC3765971.1 hypothetical protein [Neptunicella marina]